LLSQEIQYFVTGVSVGSIYALVALGFTIIHSVTGIVNFAQGEFVMLGGMVCYFLLHALGIPLWASAFLSVIIVSGIGLLFQRLALAPVRQASIVSLVIITIGASILIRGVVGQFWPWGKEAVRLPYFTQAEPLSFLGAVIHPQKLWVLGVTIVFMVAFHLLLTRTPLGKALRASAINKRAAGMVGIDVGAMALLSFGIAAAMGAVGGVLIASQAVTSYDAGIMLGLKGFLAASMGGLSSQVGAVAGGLGLGLLEAFAAGHISSAWKDALSLSVFLLFLLIRAQKLPHAESEH